MRARTAIRTSTRMAVIRKYEQEMLAYMEKEHADILAAIREKKRSMRRSRRT